jgi:hypothetical protein
MMKLAVSIVCLCAAFLVLMAWLAGSHGHLMLRIHRTEDWIFLSLLIAPAILFIFFFVSWLRSKR